MKYTDLPYAGMNNEKLRAEMAGAISRVTPLRPESAEALKDFLDACSVLVEDLTTTPAAPVNTVAPAISGTAQEGETLTATLGTWTGYPTPSKSIQWYTDEDTETAIDGATALTYEVTEDDVGHKIFVRVTGNNALGEVTADSADTATVIAAE